MKIDTLEFDKKEQSTKLCVNGDIASICTHTKGDPRIHLIVDYLICFQLQRLKLHNINVYDKPPARIDELEEIICTIGLSFHWAEHDRLLIVEER